MSRQPLRILCFGDSLTSGYYHMGLGSRPYAIKLGQILMANLKNHEIMLTRNGEPGDVATGIHFKERLIKQRMLWNLSDHIVSSILFIHRPTYVRTKTDRTYLFIYLVDGNQFDWMILLAGTK